MATKGPLSLKRFHFFADHRGDEFTVCWQAFGANSVALREAVEKGTDILARNVVCKRRPALRRDPLADHHLAPAVVEEEFVLLAHDEARLAEQCDLLRQSVWKLHVPAEVPEGALAAVGEIVKCDEIADAGPFARRQPVERVTRLFHPAKIAWKEVEQPADCRLDQMD